MTVRDLRQKYLQFFESKGHSVYPSASLIPYDVTGRLDESLLFTGAGMVQFKPFFRGVAQPPSKLLTNCQKCVRTGDIEEVGDLSHLTFFEMLGNFSFGEYFKKGAIAYSWEFMTSPEWLGLDPKRLSFTVFEEDDEAYDAWAAILKEQGFVPEHRIFRLGEETNYWPAGAFSSGPPGPCGPNSEMFYWVDDSTPPPSGPYSVEDWLRDEDKWLEIWNDVFIQYEWKGKLRNPDRTNEGYEKEALEPLPFQSVDTGMGLERTATALGGFKSLYDTDVFEPIIRKIEEIGGSLRYGQDPAKDRAIRIIADHIRTSVFCITDGILPGNTGRGYVLRRLIRRAVLKGQRALGFSEPFFHKVFEGVVEAMGAHYAELTERREVILETLKNEEALFRGTVHRGITVLNQYLADLKRQELRNFAEEELGIGEATSKHKFSGTKAFELYDTYGFPLEVTQELAAEAKLQVDIDEYEKALKEAQERSRAGTEREAVYSGLEGLKLLWEAEDRVRGSFTGYNQTEQDATVTAVALGGEDTVLVALDRTPFYTESGGQISDVGELKLNGTTFKVEGMTKIQGEPMHVVHIHNPQEAEKLKGASVTAQVDAKRRRSITRNHSATHLLHHALRKVLGGHVTQAGSLVSPDHLRFDFTHGKAMTTDEIAEVERLVNEAALEGNEVVIKQDVPIAEAKNLGAMALFGEKYGDKVRVVQMGESIELCGGCHLTNTAEVGLFKIISEGSAASGVRRIEAITGEKAYDWVRDQTDRTREAANILKASPQDLVTAVERTLETLKEERRKREKAESALARGAKGDTAEETNTEDVGPVKLWRRKFEGIDPKIAASALDEAVAKQPTLVALAAIVEDGKASFIAKAGPDALTKGAHAGNLVREVAKLAGGGGGGRPDFATAGAKDLAQLDNALAAAKDLLAAQLG